MILAETWQEDKHSGINFVINWKKNLAVIWISQFLSIMGFSFALPFAPYQMQALGVTDPQTLKLCVSLFAVAVPFSLAIFAPIWGILSDKYGRRPMLLRAYMGSAFFLYLMGLANSVTMLISLRFLQGVLTGTLTAAQAMVAVNTPNERSGVALGVLSSGVFSGAMMGQALGGFFAEQFGYQNAFFASSVMLIIAVILIMFGTSEKWEKPSPKDITSNDGIKKKPEFSLLSISLPILLFVCFASLTRRFDNSMLPLLVQEIHGSITGAAAWYGTLMATAAVAGILSGISLGHMADRFPPRNIIVIISIIGGIFMIPSGIVTSFPVLFVTRFILAFCVGGCEPVLQAWLSRITPEKDRGVIFGWIATARSVGWLLAPMISGAVAMAFNVRSVFFAGSILLFAFPFVIMLATKRKNTAHESL